MRKGDGERWLRAEMVKADRGDWTAPNAGSVTFGEWADSWLRGLPGLKPKTRAGYESLLRSRVLPTFGGRPLPQIVAPEVRAWVSAMDAEGLSPARIRQARQVLHAALAQAVEDGLLQKNVTERVKTPPVRPRRQAFLAPPEITALADEAEQRLAGAGALVHLSPGPDCGGVRQ